MLLPAGNGDIASLNDRQLHRISVVQDWFADPAFTNGRDSVVPGRRIAEPGPPPRRPTAAGPAGRDPLAQHGRSAALHPRTSSPRPRRSPSSGARRRNWRADGRAVDPRRAADPRRRGLQRKPQVSSADVVAKVEEYIQSQLGEDVVEFEKPTHTLRDVVGYTRLKKFMRGRVDAAVPRPGRTGPFPARRWPVRSAAARPSSSRPWPANSTCPCSC